MCDVLVREWPCQSVVFFLLCALTQRTTSVQYVPIDQASPWWTENFPNQTDTSICPELTHPVNGMVKVTGHIATYSCRTNYSMVSVEGPERGCVEGEWIGVEPECKRNGEWTSWTEWSPCTVSCGGGEERRRRTCTNPPPEPGGKDCVGGKPEETRECNTNICPQCTIQRNVTIGDLQIDVGATGDFLEFSCPASFRVDGNKTQPCANLDEIEITSRCIRACPQLTNPANGSVTINPENTEAVYACNVGFSLLGSAKRLCVDGAWTGSEPTCFIESFEDGEVEPLGAQPTMGLPAGTFDILTPDIAITHCNASLTFNLRTSAPIGIVLLDVDLFLFDDTDELETVPVANVSALEFHSGDYLGSGGSVCLTLRCSDPEILGLPRAGRARIGVTVPPSTVADVSNVNFVDGRPCDAIVDPDNENDTCDDTDTTGDCGYRNTGCGSSSFELVTNVPQSADEVDESVPVVPLLTNQTAKDCKFSGVCIPCLLQSGFTISSDTADSVEERKRKKRMARRRNNHKKAFCIENGYSEMLLNGIDLLRKGPKNKYMSFGYIVYANGNQHYLAVSLRCTDTSGTPHVINLKHDETPYFLSLHNADFTQGDQCLDLHTNLEKVTDNKCDFFDIVVQAGSSGSKICFTNHKLRRTQGGRGCRMLNN